MLVDNSIVVMENIFRLKKEGYSNKDAAIKGTEGGMDPKGDCDDCTNEEIKAAVEYIVSQTQK